MLLALLEHFAHFRFQTVMPGRLGQHAPAMAVAASGDAALHPFVAAGMLAGRQAQEVHEGLGICKTSQVPDFGHQRYGREHLHTAQAH